MSDIKISHAPEIMLDNSFDPESVEAIRQFDENLRSYPEQYVLALNTVYSIGMSAVGKVVEFVGAEGDNSKILHTLNKVFEEGIDLELEFDKTTEESISQDKTITEIKNKKNRTKEDAFLLRRKRLLKYARRIVEYSEYAEDDIAQAV